MTHYSHKPDFSFWASPPAPPASPPPSGARRIIWGALFWLALIPLLIQTLAPTLSPGPADDERETDVLSMRQMELEFQSRLLIAALDLARRDAVDRAPLTGLSDGSVLTPFLESDDPELLRLLLIVAGHVGLNDLARQAHSRLEEQGHPPVDDGPDRDRALAGLYLTDPPIALDDALAARLTEQYGWVGRLLEADQAALVDSEHGARLEAAIVAESQSALLRMGVMVVGGVALMLVGAIALIMFAYRLMTGRLVMPGPGSALGPQSAFEAFTLYLVISALLLFLGDVGPPSALLGAFSLVWIVGSPMLLIWPIAWGESREATLSAVGLHGARGVAREALAGVLGYTALIPCLVVASVISSLIAGALGQSLAAGAHPLAPMLIQSPTATQIVLMALLAVVIAPITEEIFFRGFLYYWLRSRYGVPASIVASALLFAALHPQGLIGLPLLFTLGAGFAVLREWRGSLVAPMVAHACVNGVTTVMLLVI